MIVIRAFNKRFDQLDQTEKHHHFIWSPVEVLKTLQRKIWGIKIGTHCEKGTKQTTEQRPEKKPNFLNMDGNDITRAVTYWMTTCLRARPQEIEAGSDCNSRKVQFADANSKNEIFRETAQPALTPWQKSGDKR
ncbi:hypothetical protein PROFUN_15607 [Planoprotostelium fungivorum]|uniref:Uncharacterized protein n=1 Tax=Planoprotostelium fungivorum TaxID=1890364 RepID=A0A2P6MYR6_9EUKA|nr:hypothetical protein PROFUN_15607 [Planoprotostelium fungivorum]